MTQSQTLPVRSSGEGTGDPQLDRTPAPGADRLATSTLADVTGRAMQAITGLENTASTVASSHRDLSRASNVAESLGLGQVVFTGDKPIVNAEGAVAARFNVQPPRAAYLDMSGRLKHIVEQEGYLYAIACAVHDCGANAAANPSREKGEGYFNGAGSVLKHCYGAHRDEMHQTFGNESVDVEEFSANRDFCRRMPITPADLILIIAGKTPASIARNTGKRGDKAGRRASNSDVSEGTLLPLTSSRKRAAEAIGAGIFKAAAIRSQQKQSKQCFNFPMCCA